MPVPCTNNSTSVSQVRSISALKSLWCLTHPKYSTQYFNIPCESAVKPIPGLEELAIRFFARREDVPVILVVQKFVVVVVPSQELASAIMDLDVCPLGFGRHTHAKAIMPSKSSNSHQLQVTSFNTQRRTIISPFHCDRGQSSATPAPNVLFEYETLDGYLL